MQGKHKPKGSWIKRNARTEAYQSLALCSRRSELPQGLHKADYERQAHPRQRRREKPQKFVRPDLGAGDGLGHGPSELHQIEGLLLDPDPTRNSNDVIRIRIRVRVQFRSVTYRPSPTHQPPHLTIPATSFGTLFKRSTFDFIGTSLWVRRDLSKLRECPPRSNLLASSPAKVQHHRDNMLSKRLRSLLCRFDHSPFPWFLCSGLWIVSCGGMGTRATTGAGGGGGRPAEGVGDPREGGLHFPLPQRPHPVAIPGR